MEVAPVAAQRHDLRFAGTCGHLEDVSAVSVRRRVVNHGSGTEPLHEVVEAVGLDDLVQVDKGLDSFTLAEVVGELPAVRSLVVLPEPEVEEALRGVRRAFVPNIREAVDGWRERG